jgi:hypothetical protein
MINLLIFNIFLFFLMEIHVKNEFLILFKNKKVAVVLVLSTLTWIFVFFFFLKKKKKLTQLGV